MGMSSSQARLLSITARINDIEYKSQSISNSKIRLADESEQVAREYTQALNKTKLTYNSYDASGNAVKYSINSTNLSGVMSDKFELRKADGTKVTVGGANGMKFSESQLYEMIESGEYILYSKQVTDADDYAAHSTSRDYSVVPNDEDANVYYKWAATSVSGNTQLAIESDTTELAKAEADYNAKTLKINNKEKLLDNDLKSLDTEHNALTTEMDSIKSLIGDNVEKTFNLFS